MSEERKIIQQCIICDGEGHTYLNCNKLSFLDLLMGSMGVPDIASGRSAGEVITDATQQIETLNEM